MSGVRVPHCPPFLERFTAHRGPAPLKSPRDRLRAAFKLAGALVAIGIHGVAIAQSGGGSPVDLANPLVGTAPLDRQELIGNAPPPGEPVYSGQTSPGARLPHSSVEAAPINNNIAFTFPNGVPVPYFYTNPTMLGFSGGGGSTYGGDAEPIISPVTGDWSMPPDYRESAYDKAVRQPRPGITRSISIPSRLRSSSPQPAGQA